MLGPHSLGPPACLLVLGPSLRAPFMPLIAGAPLRAPSLPLSAGAPRLPRDAFIGGANIDHAVFLCLLGPEGPPPVTNSLVELLPEVGVVSFALGLA